MPSLERCVACVVDVVFNIITFAYARGTCSTCFHVSAGPASQALVFPRRPVHAKCSAYETPVFHSMFRNGSRRFDRSSAKRRAADHRPCTQAKSNYGRRRRRGLAADLPHLLCRFRRGAIVLALPARGCRPSAAVPGGGGRRRWKGRGEDGEAARRGARNPRPRPRTASTSRGARGGSRSRGPSISRSTSPISLISSSS